ncbi:MAG: S26 family signal peptidase [Zavarzinella sp.]
MLAKIFRFIIGRPSPESRKKNSHGDATREVVETVVFVISLVLILKLFVAEAFVIPTGSMADTLWGDQIVVECSECKHKFPVSFSNGEHQENDIRGMGLPVACQNCGFEQFARVADWATGDRVLVAKYDHHIRAPKRFEVPVFKFPQEPYKQVTGANDYAHMNYIKRLVGLPGETIGILGGDLFVYRGELYPDLPKPDSRMDLWKKDFCYVSNAKSISLFQEGKFELIRKSPDEILNMKRLVFDTDHLPSSVRGASQTRWHIHPDSAQAAGWQENEKKFIHNGPDLGWIRYQHVQPGWDRSTNIRQPAPIRDFLAYNKGTSSTANVVDLIIEAEAEFNSSQAKISFELARYGVVYHVDFVGGKCLLSKSTLNQVPVAFAESTTKIVDSGKFAIRVANVDCRLTVWVDGKVLDFSGKNDYPPTLSIPADSDPRDVNEPIRIGASGDISLGKLKLFRDIYYLPNESSHTVPETYFVQPGHYLCFGDNCIASADSRSWGTVPERLMLGRAVAVYYPISRWGLIK